MILKAYLVILQTEISENACLSVGQSVGASDVKWPANEAELPGLVATIVIAVENYWGAGIGQSL